MQSINSFSGEYRFLSNFWMCDIEYEGLVYPSTEHAFQAAKTLDQEKRQPFAKGESPRYHKPGDAKRAGRYLELREDWEEVKDEVMRQVLLYKFENYPELREKLLATGDAELVEGNHWGDKYWGVCNGEGLNRLGKILMEVREKLRG